ncbi:MAG: phosphoribosyltransferase [Steroidobacteraceae bacterium]
MIFRDRREAGRLLAEHLQGRVGESPLVLGLARGGVPVAFEVAKALKAPLDVLVVRKLGAPFQPELAMGAIAAGGVVVRNEEVLGMLPEAETALRQASRREQVELQRREQAYRGERSPLAVQGREVVLVDDGVATGASVEAAILALRQLGAARIVLAAPVGAPESMHRLRALADDTICLSQPARFAAVGQAYESFGQIGDEEVRALLAEGQFSAPAHHPQREA